MRIIKQRMYTSKPSYFFLIKQYGIVVLVFMCFQLAQAQNLVADSSFENNKFTPTLLSSIDASGTWSSPTRATTDLFCECGKKQKETSEADVPRNPMGVQKALTGKCYAGIYAFSHGDYREYLFTQLNSLLEAGIKYELSMYVSLADYSRVAVDQLGACFLRSKVTYTSSDVITGLKPVYAKIGEDIGTDTVNWHQVIFEYKAKGGEQFLLIGSFDIKGIQITDVKAPKGVRTRINQKTERDAYYFIDDVSLHQVYPPVVAYFDTTVVIKTDTLPMATLTKEPDKDAAGEVELDKPLVLKNVLFESNKAVLLASSYPELNILVGHLITKPELKIEISGHTDNKGSAIQNTKLSEKRAKSVCDYLIAKSIDPGRLTYKGYGSLKPIAPNDTEDGRKQNRRVEFVFYK